MGIIRDIQWFYVRESDAGCRAVYDIEMQVADTRELPKRSRYYQSMIDLQMIDKGQSCKKLKPSYVIFICSFDVFNKGRHEYMTLLMRDQVNIEKGKIECLNWKNYQFGRSFYALRLISKKTVKKKYLMYKVLEMP